MSAFAASGLLSKYSWIWSGSDDGPDSDSPQPTAVAMNASSARARRLEVAIRIGSKFSREDFFGASGAECTPQAVWAFRPWGRFWVVVLSVSSDLSAIRVTSIDRISDESDSTVTHQNVASTLVATSHWAGRDGNDVGVVNAQRRVRCQDREDLLADGTAVSPLHSSGLFVAADLGGGAEPKLRTLWIDEAFAGGVAADVQQVDRPVDWFGASVAVAQVGDDFTKSDRVGQAVQDVTEGRLLLVAEESSL